MDMHDIYDTRDRKLRAIYNCTSCIKMKQRSTKIRVFLVKAIVTT